MPMSSLWGKNIIRRTFNEYRELHDDGDTPAMMYEDGSYTHYRNGGAHHSSLHAEFDAPRDIKRWFVNGLKHRTDGPAVVWNNGRSGLWYINGFSVDKLIRHWASDIEIDLNNLSEDDKVIIAMVWGDYHGVN